MKIFLSFGLIICLCCSSLIVFTQTLPVLNFYPQKNECYIIARGTKSKQSFISKKFNVINDSITHIGIGVMNKNKFQIFNVNAVRDSNALSIDSFESFLNQEDLIYYGIWKMQLNNDQLSTLKMHLTEIITGYIRFDFDFIVKDDNNLYCSEFCWLATNKLGPEFQFNLKKIQTSDLGLNLILKREVLEYIPLDYFLTFPSTKYITSWWQGN